ncbi:MAG: hypothetical protein R3301_19445 [Saprospiraceae bacterium]|nr:hypothetical protein [Saprospiraceae bacterium]
MSKDFALLLCAVFFFGLWVAEGEDKLADFEHNEYCARVAAHEADATIGHRDYLGQCEEDQ